MDNSFAHRSAVITGAGQGIGFALACKLLEQGARVLLNDRDAGLLDQVEKSLSPWKDQVILFPGDASQKKVILAMVDTAVKKFGSLEMAIANAGLTFSGDFLNFQEDHLYQMLHLNLGGSFLLAQAAAAHMTGQGKGGRILFMSSVTGFQAHRHLEGYGMTKAALRMLARSLGPQLAPAGITVNCIAPGATITERTTEIGDEYAKGWSEVIPTGHPATTEDIAYAGLFLLGRGASHITGQTLVVDGGWTATSPLPEHI